MSDIKGILETEYDALVSDTPYRSSNEVTSFPIEELNIVSISFDPLLFKTVNVSVVNVSTFEVLKAWLETDYVKIVGTDVAGVDTAVGTGILIFLLTVCLTDF